MTTGPANALSLRLFGELSHFSAELGPLTMIVNGPTRKKLPHRKAR